MKSFLLRFKGTIFASAQIQKMTSKWVKKSCGLRLTEFELKNPPWDFHGLKNTCSFICKPTTKSIESCVYFTEFFGFRFLTRVPMGNYLPVWALKSTQSIADPTCILSLQCPWMIIIPTGQLKQDILIWWMFSSEFLPQVWPFDITLQTTSHAFLSNLWAFGA